MMVYYNKEWDETVVVHHLQHYLTCDLCGKQAIWENNQIPPVNGWFTSNNGLHYCSTCDDKRTNALADMRERKNRKLGRPRGSKNKKLDLLTGIQPIGAMGDDAAWKERLLKLENACVLADKKV